MREDIENLINKELNKVKLPNDNQKTQKILDNLDEKIRKQENKNLINKEDNKKTIYNHLSEMEEEK